MDTTSDIKLLRTAKLSSIIRQLRVFADAQLNTRARSYVLDVVRDLEHKVGVRYRSLRH